MRKASLLLCLPVLLSQSTLLTVRGVTLAEKSAAASETQAIIAVSGEIAYAKTQRSFADSGGADPPNKRALRRQVTPRRRLLPVVDQPDIALRHRLIANEVLRALPDRCRSSLTDFYVRYDQPENRGLAGKSILILNGNVPDDEFRALLIHELGHVVDLGCLQGSAAGGGTPFVDGTEAIFADDPSVGYYRISWTAGTQQRLGTAEDDFVSGYAASDPFEDFAEGFAYFVLQNAAFRDRAKRNRPLALKYRWFAQYFGTTFSVATGTEPWTGRVPWDSTKLSYEWHPGTNVARGSAQ